MENNKETLEAQLHEIRKEKYRFEAEKKDAISKLEAEKYLPLIEQANDVKYEIHNSINAKYKDDFTTLNEKEKELVKALDEIKLNKAASIWHTAGTIVTLYESRRYQNGYFKKDFTGTVQIYDGSQQTPDNMNRHSLPCKGDVVVFHNKKDGTMGKKFDIISSYGKIKKWFPMWLAEGETPTDNLKTKLDAKETITEEV